MESNWFKLLGIKFLSFIHCKIHLEKLSPGFPKYSFHKMVISQIWIMCHFIKLLSWTGHLKVNIPFALKSLIVIQLRYTSFVNPRATVLLLYLISKFIVYRPQISTNYFNNYNNAQLTYLTFLKHLTII